LGLGREANQLHFDNPANRPDERERTINLSTLGRDDRNDKGQQPDPAHEGRYAEGLAFMLWLTPKEFSTKTGVPIKTVYRWIETGKLPYSRLPRSARIQIDWDLVSTMMQLKTREVPTNVISLDARRRAA
jgi:excisionase family DNA binding protein